MPCSAKSVGLGSRLPARVAARQTSPRARARGCHQGGLTWRVVARRRRPEGLLPSGASSCARCSLSPNRWCGRHVRGGRGRACRGPCFSPPIVPRILACRSPPAHADSRRSCDSNGGPRDSTSVLPGARGVVRPSRIPPPGPGFRAWTTLRGLGTRNTSSSLPLAREGSVLPAMAQPDQPMVLADAIHVLKVTERAVRNLANSGCLKCACTPSGIREPARMLKLSTPSRRPTGISRSWASGACRAAGRRRA
jgi:hypothetical protein